MRKHHVSLCRNLHAAKFLGKPGGFGDLNARQLIEAACPVKHVGAYPVRSATYLSGDSTDVNREAVPKRGKIIDGASRVSSGQSGNDKRPAVFESQRVELDDRHGVDVGRHSVRRIIILVTRNLTVDSCQQLTKRSDCSASGSGLHLEAGPQFPDEYAPRSERPWPTM
jgi:hypothetical protein